MTREDRWAHLVNAAFRLDAGRELPRAAREALIRQVLESAIDVFPEGLEPLEDFEGYAVRRLLLGLRAAGSEGA